MVCDHDSTRASLRVFLAATEQHAFQDFGDETGTLLLGNCRGCRSTLAVQIDLARGSIVRGEIETPDCLACQLNVQDVACTCPPETAEQHAERIIR